MDHALTVAAIFAAFAAVHSLTVSRAFKSRLAGFLGERWMRAYYRLLFTVFSAAMTLAAAYLIIIQPDVFLYRPPDCVLWPMHVVQLGGVLLLFSAFRPFDAGFFTGVRQAALYARTGRTSGGIEGMPDGPLVTSGAYGLVRHPMYLGGIAVFVFEPNLTVNCLVLRALAAAYFVWGCIIEERRFAADFGEDYAEYKRRVPMLNIFAGVYRKSKRGG